MAVSPGSTVPALSKYAIIQAMPAMKLIKENIKIVYM
jgi:hypothetical protein